MAVVMRIDVSGINEIVGAFDKMPDKLEKARDYALTKTKPVLITAIKKNVLKKYNISQDTLFQKMRSYSGKEEISLVFKGRRLSPLSFEGTTPTEPPKLMGAKKKPFLQVRIGNGFKTVAPPIPYTISYTVLNGRPRIAPPYKKTGKPYLPFLMPNVNRSEEDRKYFIARKTGKARSLVSGFKTVSIPQMISNEKISPIVQQKATEAFMRHFANRAAYLGAITKKDKNAVLNSLGIKAK